MGTNYYLRKKAQYPCDDAYYHNDFVQELTNGYVFNNTYYPSLEELNSNYYREYHIGKDSRGWHFLLGTYPEENINNLEDWKLLMKDGLIFNEYGEPIKFEDMINIITNKHEWYYEGYDKKFSLGKRNLLKHEGRYIIDNDTDGTYDIIEGSDFR